MKKVVLKSTVNDVQDFYIKILGGKIIRKYSLKEKDAAKKYELPMQLDVYEVKLQDINLELLIYEVLEQDCLQHIYLEVDSLSEIVSRAAQKKINVQQFEYDEIRTYILKDNNNNLFELASKKKKKTGKLANV